MREESARRSEPDTPSPQAPLPRQPGDTDPFDEVVGLQARWSTAATAAKNGLVRARTTMILLGLAGSAFEAAAAHTPWAPRIVGVIIGSVLLGAATLAGATRLGLDATARWTSTRSVSAALKSQLYLYATRTPPYDTAQRGHRLLVRVRGIVDPAAHPRPAGRGLDGVTRPWPEVTDAASYARLRVEEQIERYYRPKAAQSRRRLRAARALAGGLTLGGIGLGALAAARHDEFVAAWVAVTTAASGAALTFAAGARYEENAIAYARTADQLAAVLETWRSGPRDAEAGVRLVVTAEQIISIENDAWMARWHPTG